jgi:arylsulfatase A-like enzyme
LKQLATEGTHMEQAYAPTATTGPTHATLLTSLYPIAHGVLKNGMDLDGGLVTLAEVLKAHGYATAAVVSSFALHSKFGYGQGFDVYQDHFEPRRSTLFYEELWGRAVDEGFDQRADETTSEAIALLKELSDQERPFFLFVHYFDPHNPYSPPEPWVGRFGTGAPADRSVRAAINAYDEEIAFADHEIGRLLSYLDASGRFRDTLVIVTADHGEGLMQHGHMRHGVHIYEEAVRVPLIFRLPGRIAVGRTLREPVELLDVMPTVLELVGVAGSEELQGRSLVAALGGSASLDPKRPVYLYRRHYAAEKVGEIPVAGQKFGIRSGPWKYIEGTEEGTRELFDLENDPGEEHDVREEFPGVAEYLRLQIADWKQAYGRDVGIETLSPEDAQRLEALGYVE